MDEEFSCNYIAFRATNDPDTLYFHEILQAPDKEEFLKAMSIKIAQHNQRKNWRLVRRSKLPPHTRVLPSVWAMRRKRDLTTVEIVKWKARINVDGSKQQPAIDFEQTFASIASWASIRLLLILAITNNWIIKQLDFVQAFPQAPVEYELYIEIPKGCQVSEGDTDYVLQVLNNIYGQRQAGKVWYDFLTSGLIEKLGFTQSQHDPYILWRGSCIIIIYTDDTIVTGSCEKEISQVIRVISNHYEITHSDRVSDLLGVNITRNEQNVLLSQQKLIQSILGDLKLDGNPKTRTTPALSSVVLHAHID
jgi:Reverse transcriptase (RNA-dependent DNA polymerase)